MDVIIVIVIIVVIVLLVWFSSWLGKRLAKKIIKGGAPPPAFENVARYELTIDKMYLYNDLIKAIIDGNQQTDIINGNQISRFSIQALHRPLQPQIQTQYNNIMRANNVVDVNNGNGPVVNRDTSIILVEYGNDFYVIKTGAQIGQFLIFSVRRNGNAFLPQAVYMINEIGQAPNAIQDRYNLIQAATDDNTKDWNGFRVIPYIAEVIAEFTYLIFVKKLIIDDINKQNRIIAHHHLHQQLARAQARLLILNNKLQEINNELFRPELRSIYGLVHNQITFHLHQNVIQFQNLNIIEDYLINKNDYDALAVYLQQVENGLNQHQNQPQNLVLYLCDIHNWPRANVIRNNARILLQRLQQDAFQAYMNRIGQSTQFTDKGDWNNYVQNNHALSQNFINNTNQLYQNEANAHIQTLRNIVQNNLQPYINNARNKLRAIYGARKRFHEAADTFTVNGIKAFITDHAPQLQGGALINYFFVNQHVQQNLLQALDTLLNPQAQAQQFNPDAQGHFINQLFAQQPQQLQVDPNLFGHLFPPPVAAPVAAAVAVDDDDDIDDEEFIEPVPVAVKEKKPKSDPYVHVPVPIYKPPPLPVYENVEETANPAITSFLSSIGEPINLNDWNTNNKNLSYALGQADMLVRANSSYQFTTPSDYKYFIYTVINHLPRNLNELYNNVFTNLSNAMRSISHQSYLVIFKVKDTKLLIHKGTLSFESTDPEALNDAKSSTSIREVGNSIWEDIYPIDIVAENQSITLKDKNAAVPYAIIDIKRY